MAKLTITRFGSLAPRVSPRELPAGAATTAINADVKSKDLRPIKPVQPVIAVSGGVPVSAYRAEWNGSEKWRTWTKDVDVVRAPLSVETEARFYWSGDGEPRYATFTEFGATEYRLGLPYLTANIAGPNVAVTGGTGPTETRSYLYTFITELGEESAPCRPSDPVTGNFDGTWAISSISPAPVNSGSIASASYDAVSGTTSVTTLDAHWLSVGDEVVLNGSTVSVTSSTYPATFVVQGDYSTATTWSRAVPWRLTNLKLRIYRTIGTSADWQLVDEIAPATSYNDTKSTASQIMGDSLVSNDYEPPPAQIRGFGILPNGVLFGFYGTTVYLSDPYQPHAFPLNNQYSVDFPIVGLASFGNSICIATEGNTYVLDGASPSSATLRKVGTVWPCKSKRSVIGLSTGAVYASDVGMIYVSDADSVVWTKDYYTEFEWADLVPTTMISAISKNQLFIQYTTSSKTGILVFDFVERTLMELDFSAFGLLGTLQFIHHDLRNGELYLITDVAAHQYDASVGAAVSYEWISSEMESPKAVTMSAMRCAFDSTLSEADIAAINAQNAAIQASNSSLLTNYDGHGGFSGFAFGSEMFSGSNFQPLISTTDSLTVELMADGRTKASVSLSLGDTDEILRIPTGYRGRIWKVRIVGTMRVKSIEFASNPLEIANG